MQKLKPRAGAADRSRCLLTGNNLRYTILDLEY